MGLSSDTSLAREKVTSKEETKSEQGDLPASFPNPPPSDRTQEERRGGWSNVDAGKGWEGCLEDGRSTGRGFFGFAEGAIAVEGGQYTEVRVMDRLPLPSDCIDETLIRVEWPDPTGKYRQGAHPDKPPPHTKRLCPRRTSIPTGGPGPGRCSPAAAGSCGVAALSFRFGERDTSFADCAREQMQGRFKVDSAKG